MERNCIGYKNSKLLFLIDEPDDVLSLYELHVLYFIANLLKYLLRIATLCFNFIDWNHFDCNIFLCFLIDSLVHGTIGTITKHFILVNNVIIHHFIWRSRSSISLILAHLFYHFSFTRKSPYLCDIFLTNLSLFVILNKCKFVIYNLICFP